MTDISLANAKARLSEIVTRAAAGELIRITRRGKPVVQLSAVQPPTKKKIDVDAIERLTAGWPSHGETDDEFIRLFRDGERY